MNEISSLFTNFYKQRMSTHIYPSEFLIRTMLGTYPKLALEKNYENKNILDLGFGDGRNMILLHHLRAKIFGVEMTEELCQQVFHKMEQYGIPTHLAVGHNAQIPFPDNFFDYIVASASLYYVQDGEWFSSNKNECCRVLKQGGWLIASLAHTESFIFNGATNIGNDHYIIQKDPYRLRNGTILKGFSSKEAIVNEFSNEFEALSIGESCEDYYGIQIKLWFFCGRLKS